MKKVPFNDEMQEAIASTHCFTAAQGKLGQMAQTHTSGPIDPRLHKVVTAVVVLRNGECFVSTVVCRQSHPETFESAAARAQNKALRKVRDHLKKDLVGTLI